MKDREKEYREIFVAEALQEYDELNRHIVDLERDPGNDKLLAEIFRLLHNLKANAKATGLDHISDLSHHLENIFSLIRKHEVKFEGDVITVLLDAFDYLGVLLQNIENTEFYKLDERIINTLAEISKISASGGTFHAPVKKIYTSQNISLSDLIYIQIKKLDDILNLVGELIIDRDRIISIANQTDNLNLKVVSAHLERITNDLQFSVMNARLVSIGALFNKFPRIVRDVAITEGKKVDLEITGQDIQIDRNILQIITDSLLHIIRNAITHGIEPEEERKKKGKLPVGRIFMDALSDKDMVIIKVSDDGKGMNIDEIKSHAVSQRLISREKVEELTTEDVLSFIFEPGFSLSKQVTDISGRGVGLDIVKNALDAIGGRVSVDSKKDEGTTFSLYLPNSIAVKGALLFEVDGNDYAIPLIHTESVVNIPNSEMHQVGGSFFADIKGETIPVIFLSEFFRSGNTHYDMFAHHLIKKPMQDIVIISYNNRKLGLVVDKLLRQQDIVVKMLQKPVDNIELFSGVTLLGNGEVCLVLDVPAISKKYIIKKDAGEVLN